MKKAALIIDIGGSKFMVALADIEGIIYVSRQHVWVNLNADGVVCEILSAAKKLINEYPQYTPDAVGVTIPGLANPQKGLWVDSSFSGIKNLQIAKILEEEFNIPVYVENDGQACALAEKYYGAGKETEYFLYVTVSNGIGGAIYTPHGLYYGEKGNAGEIGHCVVVENGRTCKCGTKGCLEMYAAGPGISKNYLELGGKKLLSAKEIALLAKNGDSAAINTFKKEGEYLGKALAIACNLINPQKIILGGGVSLNFEFFKDSLNTQFQKGLYKKANVGVQIVPTALGYNGGLYGALALIKRKNLFEL